MARDDGVADGLAAGDFADWIRRTRAADGDTDGAEVPCDGCTACCTSAQFVHIDADETATLARIPAELRFPAPGRSEGTMVLGYDENGHCPMLVDGACSIYEHRPRTCRTYDCRVFPAAGLEPEGAAKVAIVDRVRRWRFSFPTEADEEQHRAVRAAAAYLRANAMDLPAGAVPGDATQLAAMAVEIHELFLGELDVEPDCR